MRKTAPRLVAIVSVFAAVITAALLAGCGSSSSSSGSSSTASGGEDGTIDYGLLTALSGSTASWGTAEKASDQIAIDEINKRGGVEVDGKKYKFALKTYDNGYDPTKTATVGRQAIEQDGIQFVENLGGGTVAAVQPIAERAGVLLFCSCSGSEFLGEDHPNTFRPYYDDAQSLASILQYFKQKNPSATHIAQIYTDDDVGHETIPLTEKPLEEAGLTSSVTYVPRDATELYPVLTKVLQDNPEAIDVGASPEGLYDGMVKQARELGFKGPFMFPDAFDFSSASKALPAGDLVGSLSAPCNLTAGSATGKKWAKAYEDMTGEEPQWWSAQSHDNVLLLAEAIEKAQSLEPDAVAEAMSEVSVEGATSGGGTVKYGGEEAFGLPRAFEVPYPVCEITPGGPGGRGVQKQVTKG
ncbi:MAG TPA: ABC transporter substrate-binding protein [Solirubrobacterales bacterium]|jgi:branched-chain amino acid transport system substrate-binding protein